MPLPTKRARPAPVVATNLAPVPGPVPAPLAPKPQPQTASQAPSACGNGNVTVLSKIDVGACGEISVIRFEDPKRDRSEVRGMKEMRNGDEKKCFREKEQFESRKRPKRDESRRRVGRGTNRCTL